MKAGLVGLGLLDRVGQQFCVSRNVGAQHLEIWVKPFSCMLSDFFMTKFGGGSGTSSPRLRVSLPLDLIRRK